MCVFVYLRLKTTAYCSFRFPIDVTKARLCIRSVNVSFVLTETSCFIRLREIGNRRLFKTCYGWLDDHKFTVWPDDHEFSIEVLRACFTLPSWCCDRMVRYGALSQYLECYGCINIGGFFNVELWIKTIWKYNKEISLRSCEIQGSRKCALNLLLVSFVWKVVFNHLLLFNSLVQTQKM